MIEEELKQKANPNNYASFGEWLKANKWLVILSPIYLIFGLVAALLALFAKLFGITYKEMNIFVYYFLIPISWSFIIDVFLLQIQIPLQSEEYYREFHCGGWWNVHLLSDLWCMLWAFIIYNNRHGFRAWCVRAFDNSVKFLLWFKVIGWNYYVSSVIICVIVPLLVYVGLFCLCVK
jgi:hypothetical protein